MIYETLITFMYTQVLPQENTCCTTTKHWKFCVPLRSSCKLSDDLPNHGCEEWHDISFPRYACASSRVHEAMIPDLEICVMLAYLMLWHVIYGVALLISSARVSTHVSDSCVRKKVPTVLQLCTPLQQLDSFFWPRAQAPSLSLRCILRT